LHAFCLITSENICEYGGIQKFVLDLTKFFIENGHSVVLVSGKDSFPPVSVSVFEPLQSRREFCISNVKRTNQPANPINMLLFSLLATFALIRICRKRRVLVIHAQDIFFSGFAGTVAHKLLNIPLIVHAHGPSPYFFEATPEATKIRRILMHSLARLVMCNSDLILTTDTSTEETLLPFYGKTKCLCIPTPIDIQVYSKKLSPELGSPTLE